MKRRNQSIIALTAGFLFLFSIPLFAGVVENLHEFHEGDPAVASEVNENFDNVKSAVDDNNARIETKQNRVRGVCADGSSIRRINEDGTVVCEPDNIGSGDITSVIAGDGLDGGGTTGEVTLSIEEGAVGQLEIATDGVGSDEIDNGSIIDADINNNAAISANKIADGSGSGLDADFLDGEEGSNYVRRNEETIALSGDLVVAGELDVSGDLIVPNVVYDPVHTHYLSIPACAFRSGPSDLAATEEEEMYTEMHAAVYLPDDAIVTSFMGYFHGEYINSTYFSGYLPMDLSLGYYNLDGSGGTTMVNVTSREIDGVHSAEKAQINEPTINNRNRAYFVRAYSPFVNIVIGIKGAVITYTISEAP